MPRFAVFRETLFVEARAAHVAFSRLASVFIVIEAEGWIDYGFWFLLWRGILVAGGWTRVVAASLRSTAVAALRAVASLVWEASADCVDVVAVVGECRREFRFVDSVD